jgi:hypothetical protein
MQYGTFFGLLTLIFTVLKLTHYIDWSWWLIFLPIPLSFFVALLAVFIFVLIKHKRKK